MALAARTALVAADGIEWPDVDEALAVFDAALLDPLIRAPLTPQERDRADLLEALGVSGGH